MSTVTVARSEPRHGLGRWLLGVTAIAFGVATLVEGARLLVGGPAARAEAGDVVPFVLLFNSVAGFVYVAGGAATLWRCRWAVWAAWALAVSTLLVFAAFGVHVLAGGAFEPRTPIAMTLRAGFWVAQALLLPRWIESNREAR